MGNWRVTVMVGVWLVVGSRGMDGSWSGMVEGDRVTSREVG